MIAETAPRGKIAVGEHGHACEDVRFKLTGQIEKIVVSVPPAEPCGVAERSGNLFDRVGGGGSLLLPISKITSSTLSHACILPFGTEAGSRVLPAAVIWINPPITTE